jgi:hypothetical protein
MFSGASPGETIIVTSDELFGIRISSMCGMPAMARVIAHAAMITVLINRILLRQKLAVMTFQNYTIIRPSAREQRDDGAGNES